MASSRRSTPHLRLTAAILVAMLAALAGGLASDANDSRTRRAELHSALRFAVAGEETRASDRLNDAQVFAAPARIHDARAALIASDASSARAERSLRRLAAHARTATLRTTALPPPSA